jgi:hypothetical protein
VPGEVPVFTGIGGGCGLGFHQGPDQVLDEGGQDENGCDGG